MVKKAAAAAEKSQGETKKRLGQKVRIGIVRELRENLSGVESVLVARLDRVPTLDLNKLRQTLGGQNASFFIVKNSLCRITFRDLGWTGLESVLQGTCGVSPVKGEISAVCKLLTTFSKDHEGFVLQGGVLKGQMLQPQDIKALASLPGREVLLSRLAGVAQSPLRNLAFILQAPLRSLTMIVSALRQKKEKEENVKG